MPFEIKKLAVKSRLLALYHVLQGHAGKISIPDTRVPNESDLWVLAGVLSQIVGAFVIPTYSLDHMRIDDFLKGFGVILASIQDYDDEERRTATAIFNEAEKMRIEECLDEIDYGNLDYPGTLDTEKVRHYLKSVGGYSRWLFEDNGYSSAITVADVICLGYTSSYLDGWDIKDEVLENYPFTALFRNGIHFEPWSEVYFLSDMELSKPSVKRHWTSFDDVFCNSDFEEDEL